MSFEEVVRKLTVTAINEISFHYDNAIEAEHGSGDHWILMSVLDKYGFRTNNPEKAVKLAEEIITKWHQYQK